MNENAVSVKTPADLQDREVITHLYTPDQVVDLATYLVEAARRVNTTGEPGTLIGLHLCPRISADGLPVHDVKVYVEDTEIDVPIHGTLSGLLDIERWSAESGHAQTPDRPDDDEPDEEPLGQVLVDSGTVLLVDPANLPREALAAVLVPNEHGVTLGVLVKTPHGDGLHPVFSDDDALALLSPYGPGTWTTCDTAWLIG